MILVIHQENDQAKEYIDFLNAEKVEFYPVSVKKLIENFYVNDAFKKPGNNANGIWEFNDLKIKFSSICGIYPSHFKRRSWA